MVFVYIASFWSANQWPASQSANQHSVFPVSQSAFHPRLGHAPHGLHKPHDTPHSLHSDSDQQKDNINHTQPLTSSMCNIDNTQPLTSLACYIDNTQLLASSAYHKDNIQLLTSFTCQHVLSR